MLVFSSISSDFLCLMFFIRLCKPSEGEWGVEKAKKQEVCRKAVHAFLAPAFCSSKKKNCERRSCDGEDELVRRAAHLSRYA